LLGAIVLRSFLAFHDVDHCTAEASISQVVNDEVSERIGVHEEERNLSRRKFFYRDGCKFV